MLLDMAAAETLLSFCRPCFDRVAMAVAHELRELVLLWPCYQSQTINEGQVSPSKVDRCAAAELPQSCVQWGQHAHPHWAGLSVLLYKCYKIDSCLYASMCLLSSVFASFITDYDSCCWVHMQMQVQGSVKIPRLYAIAGRVDCIQLVCLSVGTSCTSVCMSVCRLSVGESICLPELVRSSRALACLTKACVPGRAALNATAHSPKLPSNLQTHLTCQQGRALPLNGV